ncbi:hypothetical protein [Bradyrhizobium arachidis]|uniref:DUF5648 domain-containing protein n=1 Tax=Bradyrhizobium arachidis TaxID=858423 RepID=A0AAE7NS74_9BRAD|nr:hypothetical protein [Bradyrhizobium arachidis]QOZ70142.1 hypothetical protein WN72_30425 [Bradyrhizobium arachidis]SFV19808.1 hypothetical protein SAMN05192541_16413 [Bradyrhizobium arachidis]
MWAAYTVQRFLHFDDIAGIRSLYGTRTVASDHFYTTSTVERDNAVSEIGYVSEGVACYVYNNKQAGTTELYRLLNPANGDHSYTTSVAEDDNTFNNLGHTREGVACYVYGTKQAATTELCRVLKTT